MKQTLRLNTRNPNDDTETKHSFIPVSKDISVLLINTYH